MIGGKLARQGAAAVCGILVAGCVGLGDATPGGVDATRLRVRPQPTVENPTPELRIPVDAVARGEGPDIPLVAVPVPPIGRQKQIPASPTSSPAETASPAKPLAAPATEPPPTAPTTPPQTAPAHTARQLLQQAAARCATLDSYIVRLTRREFFKDKPQPEEIMLFKFRKNPLSVHFKWLGETARGREVVYVKGQYENKIHTKVAVGDAPLIPAGARIAIAPDSFLARSASRHPITDAGICHCVESLTALLDRQESGDKREGVLVAIAPQKRPEYPKAVETLERLIPPNIEPELPRGGRRLICFDPDWQLPLLVITYDDKEREVEYYRYDRLQTPVNLDDDDFNPDKLWASPKPKTAPGLPSRDRQGAQGSTDP